MQKRVAVCAGGQSAASHGTGGGSRRLGDCGTDGRGVCDRVFGSGGEIPFDRTPEFAEVFGEGKLPEGIPCAAVSDVDMIFSNIFVESGKAAADSAWIVIDYEWTFPFPVPKKYLIYRAVYYAYYQIFKAEGKSLADWLKSAGLTEEETECFARMEVHFQEYLRAGAFPVRSMQRRDGNQNHFVCGAA